MERNAFALLMLAASAATALLCNPVLAQPVTIHIPSKPLADALTDFAVQSDVSIDETSVDLRDRASGPVYGAYSREEALGRLLAGSGLSYVFVTPTSVQIVPSARSTEPTVIENVVVTANKKAEVAQTMAGSIAVVTGAEIEETRAITPEDLLSQVAGMTATNLGPGEDKLFVRGLTDSVVPGLSESVVGLYLDDTRIADDAPDPRLELVDVDRVEVLRGPQGSLYGAGSLDGLIRIVTRKPDLDAYQAAATATFSATTDGSPSTNLQGTLNIPIVENALALRLATYHDGTGGYVDDPRLHASDTNDTTVDGLRATLASQLAAHWTLSANVTLQNLQSDDSQYYLQNLEALNRSILFAEPHADKFQLASLTANGDLGWANLVSNTSYVDRSFSSQFDASAAWPGLTGFPFGASPFDFARNIRSVSHETRVNSDSDGPLQWLLGIYLSHRDEDFNSNLIGPNASAVDVTGRSEAREDRLNEAALFGEITYNISQELSLTAGARAFDASHNVSASSTGFIAPPDDFNGANQQSGLAPKFVISYRPDFDTTIYLEYSEGYRLGGLNVDGPTNATGEAGTTFDSDILRNYEFGAKLRLLDGRATINSAIYFDEWHDVQTDQIASDGAFYTLNAGTVRALGTELEFVYLPVDNLTVKGTAFWNNAILSNTNPLLVITEGNLPGAPDVTFGLSSRYDVPLDEQDIFVSFDYSYIGPSHLGFSESGPGMGNYQIANLHLGWKKDPWQLMLFVDNITNDQKNTFAFGNPFLPTSDRQVTPPRPRTFGLSLTWTE